ncbi:MAG: M20/M25/M40 family metallo-hydrolase [Candidatus Symbiothrix sp.]|jgi:hypothetical protein|nr:M20/M25/M40 family metallo-hydrolase [Candidatus Symbiothrix sp.]
MIKSFLISTGILFLPSLHAQVTTTKGLQTITKDAIEAHVAFLASDVLEGREAGKRGNLIAAEYLKSELKETGIKPLYNDYFQRTEAYSREKQKKTSFQVNIDSVRKYKADGVYRKLRLQNVLGFIEGQKKDEYIVIGAHYDHLGIDELLFGDQIYNGADDNASSVAVVLQVAKAYAESGEIPLRSIIFAFWDGEESGYLGSEYFVSTFHDLQAIKGYINLDMVGRDGTFPSFGKKQSENAQNEQTDNSKKVFFLYSEQLAANNDLLNEDIKTHQLDLIPGSRVLSAKAKGSDNTSFADQGIPVLWFFTGIHSDYHQPSDEADKINYEKMVNIATVTYLTLHNLANKN